jgi:VIT1/CCC1 family predicted Fe2+/Mn2+ transporter
LYLMGPDGLAALATTRLIMGAPLYILGVWLAWLVTRPAPVPGTQPSKPSSSGD